MLFARRGGHALALACSAPWVRGSAGYVGASDGWEDLSRHKQLTCAYDRAEEGNVALTGEVDLAACGGVFVAGRGLRPGRRRSRPPGPGQLDGRPRRAPGEIRPRLARLAGDAGRSPKPAGSRAGATSTASARPSCKRTMPRASRARSSPASRPPGERPEATKRGQRAPGAITWSGPATWWSRPAACWPPGAKPEALRVLRYLRATQMADGHWPQNMWVSSAQFWTGIQLGETAFPILLARPAPPRRGRFRPRILARFWPMVRRAVGYIVRSGPSTQQDRWENAAGIHPVHPGGRDRRPADRRRPGR